MSAVASSNIPSPTKHALLIGIDEYSNYEKQYQLRGCVNDAKLMKRLLVDHFKFEESNIIELHNAAASQQKILAAMESVVDKISQDDVVVFHFSGHGGQLRTTDTDEGSGKSSTLCTADSGYMDPYPNLDIIDNVINEWLVRLTRKTRNVSLTFDCCHSGTITRDVMGAQARTIPADTRSLAAMGIDDSALLPPRNTREDKKTSGWSTLSDKYVVMSGCRDDELSYEYSIEGGEETVRHGALTHYLTTALLSAKPGSTYRDVFELARTGVNTRFKHQHPQIEGSQDREIFGVRDIEPFRFILVKSIANDKVTLAGGAAHGICVGSVWAAYPQGAKQTEGLTPIASIEITKVGSITSEGKLLEGKETLSVDARCVESAASAKQFLLTVDLSQLDSSAAESLSQKISESRLLTLAQTPGTGDAYAYILTQHDNTRQGINLPTNMTIETPTWVMVDNARVVNMPPRATSDAQAIDVIISNLEAISRYNNALSLNNPKSKLNVEFSLFHVDSQDKLHNINGGDFVFEEGQRLAFEIINHEPNNVYVSLLDFGLTGEISLFFPQGTSSEMIAPGVSLKIGVEEVIELQILDAFTGDQGTETVKAIITSDESDFRWMQQQGTRSIETDHSSLRQQFEAAYNGPKTRHILFRTDTLKDGDWKAISRTFELKRKKI